MSIKLSIFCKSAFTFFAQRTSKRTFICLNKSMYILVQYKGCPDHLVTSFYFLATNGSIQNPAQKSSAKSSAGRASVLPQWQKWNLTTSVAVVVVTNPKNSNFEHLKFGMSGLRTSQIYSNFKGRTSIKMNISWFWGIS